MGIVDAQVRTITCNGSCGKKVIFDQREQQQVLSKPENAWIKATRIITTADNRVLAYCSDDCELEGLKKGTHNVPTIIQAGSQAEVSEAVKYAEGVQQVAEEAKTGQGKLEVVRG